MHLRQTHSEQAPGVRQPKYVCNFPGCNKKFISTTNHQNHENAHLKRKKYACTACPKRYMYRKDLKNHKISAHGEAGGTACTKCQKLMPDKAHAKRHEKTCGTIANIQCFRCESRFKYRHNYVRHMKRKHGI